MATQEDKDYAINIIGDIDVPLVTTFMGIDINEFTKDELIRILSIQNQKWLESIGFKYDS